MSMCSRAMLSVQIVAACSVLWFTALASESFPDTASACQPAALHPNMPTFHLMNNVTRHGGGNTAALTVEPLNDANAIFLYRGVYHVMMQAGGG
eukprot:SAG31_NODE_12435_length_942_cov_1.590747_1_plen_93_part_10